MLKMQCGQIGPPWNFSDIDPPTTQGVGSIVGLMLVNAQTDSDLRLLVGGDSVVDPQSDGLGLNLRAEVTGQVESVSFEVDGVQNYRVENVAPFAAGGDVLGDYGSLGALLERGYHTIIATPYSNINRNGIAGIPFRADIKVV